MSSNLAAQAVLLDIDGVLHVGEEPIAGASAALAQLRELGVGVRLVTNTTSKSRRQIVEQLRRLGFEIDTHEVLTPAALAVRHCQQRGHRRVKLLVAEALREDLAELESDGLESAAGAGGVDAVVLGDLGDGFTAEGAHAAF